MIQDKKIRPGFSSVTSCLSTSSLLRDELVQGDVILDILGNERPVFPRYGAVVPDGEDGVGRQVGKLSGIDDVTDEVAGDVGLEVGLDGRDGPDLFGLVIGHELVEFLFQQLVPGLEAGDQVEDLLEDLPKGHAAVHGRGLSQLGQRVVLLRLVEDLPVYVVEDAVPLSGLDGCCDDLVPAHGALEFLEEHAVDPHPLGTDGLLLDRGEDVPAQVLVGACVEGNRFLALSFMGVFIDRQLQHLVVVEPGLEVLAVGEEVEELECGLLGPDDALRQARIERLVEEAVLPSAAPLDLDEVGGGEDRPEQTEIQDVRAVVAGGHHADGDADPRFARPVGGEEVARAHQVVVGEVDGELLGVRDLRRDLHGEVRLILARKHDVGHLVEGLRQPGRVVLADGKDDRLADLAAHGIAQRVLQEGLAEDPVGRFGEEAPLELALLVRLFLLLPGVIGDGDDETLVRQQLCRHLGTGVHHGGVDQVAVLHAVEQRVPEGGLPALAAEGAVGVHQQPALGFARVPRRGAGPVEALQVVPGRRGKAELVADEVVEHRAGVSADGAVRLVGDHEIEVGGREEGLVLVVEQQGLDGRDHDLGRAPVVAPLFVSHRLEVRREQGREDFPGLLLQLEAVHEEQHARGVAGAKEQLDDGRGGERLAGSRGHLEQKAVVALFRRPL